MPRPRVPLVEAASEALGLGVFMVSACAFGVFLFHPASPAVQGMPSPLARRALMGLAMGATLLGNVHAPWGRRSGAHLNPAFTLAFLRLGKVRAADAGWYVLAQLAGGLAGVALAAVLLGPALAAPDVRYVVTVPGPWGAWPAFAAECAMTFVLLLAVLWCASAPRREPWTPFAAAALLAAFITFEAPVSGMSLNPARTLGSAVPAATYTALWVYLAAPVLGMLAAAECFARVTRGRAAHCAKLLHDPSVACRFCGHEPAAAREPGVRPRR